ncbi:ASCH domain-containing protein [Naumannella halotolerans]|uniref:Uncharacterized protein YhfF n=1 Tax=Naumannella halotolerans TaxID=993414 RepID=A0A4R7J382_9ACTN|nr:ASCH domain-containing protein [Naumannella halotolerans]TDT30847.1 uncharacterized protein YhfF [Naumannella halotolerans]
MAISDDNAPEPGSPGPDLVAEFWAGAHLATRANPLPGYLGVTTGETLPPPTMAFGGTPEQQDALAELIVDGVKTATASALADYQAADEPVPSVGDLGIVVDGRGRPRALIRTTAVEVRPFDQVDAEHARLEGEGDRSLAHWQTEHRRFFTEFSHGGFSPDMPVVLERFRVLYS